ncbi:MAG TPA: NADH-quinone oxidoreductase subunit C [Hadesarchaea archaeon]|nr:NADH-quinone oxidoreductase subunit C [Hadesarchaea archaeon]
MDSKNVVELIKEYASNVRTTDERSLFVTVDLKNFEKMLQKLKEAGVTHISTITGVDTGDFVEVIYHFDCRPAMLSLKIFLPRDDPKIQTISGIFPGAVLYERDLMEMLGVRVEGHPDPRRLFLPDDWPEGEYPLRKGWREKKR